MQKRRLTKPGLSGALLLLAPFLLTACSDNEEPARVALAALQATYDESELSSSEKREEFLPRYEALAAEFWGTEAALDAKLWVMTRGPRLDDREARAAALGEHTDSIFARYADSPHMVKLVERVSSFTEEQSEKYLGQLRENSPHRSVQAAAIYYPARRALSSLRYSDAEEGADEIREALNADLQLLVDEYGDVPKGGSTYGEVAHAHLTAHTDEVLAVGQPAPEIIGVTAEGEEIRLSDFLGKVTVIDFWGDW